MSSTEAPWWAEQDAPRTQTRERRNTDDDLIDMTPTALVRQPEDDISGLAALARAGGPRDLDQILDEAREIGSRLGAVLDAQGEGTAAYYRWHVKGKGGKSVIEGPTVGMMDALAGVWGAIIYSVQVIEQKGQHVTLRGRVVDLLRIVAHQRDYRGWMRPAPAGFQGEERGRWETMQMQAAESKAVRGVLEHIIPSVVVQVAMEAARDAAAQARLGGRSLEEGVGRAIEGLKKVGLGDLEQLARWVGRPPAEWTAIDLGELRDVYARAKRGELPPDALRVEAAARAAARAGETAATPAEQPASGDRLAGLGLGEQTQPAAQAAQAAPTAEPAAESAPAATKAEAPPGKTVEPDDADQVERTRLIARFRELEPKLPAEKVTALRERAELTRIYPRSADIGKLTALVADLEEALKPAEELPPEPDAEQGWDGPTGAELLAELTDLWRELKLEQRKELLDEVGIPQLDGAPEPALRRMLTLVMDRLPLDEEG